MEISAVGLQMDDSLWLEEVAVARHEQRSCQTFLLTADLRVCKGNPYLRNLTLSKQGFDELDTCAEESHVLQAVFLGIFCSLPQTGTLDIDADIVERRIALGKVHGVVTFAAAQLDDYRIIVPEEITSPVSLERMVTVQDL